MQDHGYSEEAGTWFPHSVVRVAGLPVDCLEDLAATGAYQRALDIVHFRISMRREAECLSEALYHLIPSHSRAGRRRLLRLRRDLHNFRPPKRTDLVPLEGTDLGKAVEGLANRLHALDEATAEYREAYAGDREAAQESFRKAVADTDFGAGIRLSSESLAHRLLRFLSDPDGDEDLDSKTESGLLRYLTRAAGKATPFGRFCSIMPGEFADDTGPIAILGNPSRKWSRIRSNKRLMERVLGFLALDPAASLQIPVRLNPTLVLSPEHISFLASRSTREAFQSVARNEAIDMVVAALRDGGGGTVRGMAMRVAGMESVEATQEEAEEYLDHLIQLGLLQPDLAGLGHDPEWTDGLLKILEEMDESPSVAEANTFLVELKRRTDELQKRGLLLAGAESTDLEAFVTSTFRWWFGEGADSPAPMVYEDAAVDGKVLVDRGHFAEALERLKEFLRLATPLAWARNDKFTMCRFFRERFGTARVSLLAFYEAYYREHVKPAEEARAKNPVAAPEGADPAREGEPGEGAGPAKESDPAQEAESAKGARPVEEAESPEEVESPEAAKPAESPEPPAEVSAVRRAHEELKARVGVRWRDQPFAREIRIFEQDLRDLQEGIPPLPQEPRSFSAFVNWAPKVGHPEGGRIVLPLGQTLPGFGKYFSRFLYLLPEEVLHAVRTEIAPEPGTVVAEIAGDQAFNANLRPPIQRCEIVYPTGDRIGCPEALDVGNLEVGISASGHHLELFEKGTDRRVFPVDLGFLNPLARPPLYQLLRQFSPNTTTHVSLPWNPAPPPPQEMPEEGASDQVGDVEEEASKPTVREGSQQKSKAGVLRRPRISYEGVVILARETWLVPMAELPRPEPDEDPADFFLRLTEWRELMGIPERVYARVTGQRSPSNTQPEPGTPPPVDNAEGEEGPGEMDPDRESQEQAPEEEEQNPEGQELNGKDGHPPAKPLTLRWPGDLRKPQYMDFRSPLLVGLLTRYHRLPPGQTLAFEECLPAAEHLPVGPNGRRWVTESIIQLAIHEGAKDPDGVQESPEREAVHA